MSDSLIIRGNIRENFSVLPNDLMNDERLSADALGVLVYLLSKPTDWQVRVTELRRRFDIGRDKVYRILGSMEQYGYLVRESVKAEGQFAGTRYIVSDSPRPENPDTVFPYTENKDTYKEQRLQRTEYTKSTNKKKAQNKQKISEWEPTQFDKEYAESLELDWQEILTDIRLWDDKGGNKAAYASCKAFWQTWCRKEGKSSQRRSNRQQSASGGKSKVLSEGQKVFADNVTQKYIKAFGSQGFAYKLVLPDVEAFMLTKQTDEDWLALGNGLPSPREKGWM